MLPLLKWNVRPEWTSIIAPGIISSMGQIRDAVDTLPRDELVRFPQQLRLRPWPRVPETPDRGTPASSEHYWNARDSGLGSTLVTDGWSEVEHL